MRSITLFLILFVTPNMVSTSMTLISCRKIDRNYWAADLSLECLSEMHRKVIPIGIFSLILWLIIIPAILTIKLLKLKSPESLISF